jgi:hypothetical protein
VNNFQQLMPEISMMRSLLLLALAVSICPHATAAAHAVVLTKHAYDLTGDLDADNDGMEDAWELANSLDPNQDVDAAFDTDGDGLTNGAEFLYGSAPGTANVAPALIIASTTPSVQLTFPSVPNRSYQIEVSTDLQGWQPLGAPATTTGATGPGMVNFTDAAPGGVAKFYRLRVQVQR